VRDNKKIFNTQEIPEIFTKGVRWDFLPIIYFRNCGKQESDAKVTFRNCGKQESDAKVTFRNCGKCPEAIFLFAATAECLSKQKY
jgi:hypothetical protein